MIYESSIIFVAVRNSRLYILQHADTQQYCTATSVILQLYNSLMAWMCKHIRKNNSVFKKPLLCGTTSFLHGFKSQFNSWAQAPITHSKTSHLTSNWATSLKVYYITVLKAHRVMYNRVLWLREIDWASVITCMLYSIHSV